MRLLLSLIFSLLFIFSPARGAAQARTLSGTVVTQQNEALPGVEIRVARAAGGRESVAVSDGDGRFSLAVPAGALVLKLEGKGIAPLTKTIGPEEQTEDLIVEVQLLVPVVHESVVITASSLDPGIERRSEEVYRGTLFSRDDQVFHTLDASIRAAGLDVLDLSLTKRVRRWLDLNLSVDNLTNKRYYETQNYFESRLEPGLPAVSRIHATPGYPLGVTAGLTFRFKGK